jgi:hypothetical protein
MRMIPMLRACYAGSRCAKPGNATCRVASEQGGQPAVSSAEERRRLAKAAGKSGGKYITRSYRKVSDLVTLVARAT